MTAPESISLTGLSVAETYRVVDRVLARPPVVAVDGQVELIAVELPVPPVVSVATATADDAEGLW